MKHFLLAAMLVAVGACAEATTAPRTRATCPTAEEQGDRVLTRQQWRACFGRQDHDASGRSGR